MVNNNKTAKATADTLRKINKLLTEGRLQLCQSKGTLVKQVPLALPVHPDRGARKETGDEEGREEHLERKEIEVLWDHQEKKASKASWDLQGTRVA